jgi:hypothetical protein
MRKFRVYFNRKREAPQVWSFDEGTQASEVNVIDFRVLPGCTANGHYNFEKPNDDSPSAWMEVHADDYYMRGGVVFFTRLPADGRS